MVEPEVALFRAVLLRAFEDACVDLPRKSKPVPLPSDSFRWRRVDGRRRREWIEGIAFDWEETGVISHKTGKMGRVRKWRPEVAAWREVEAAKRERKRAVANRRDARRWLTDGGRKFREICRCAAIAQEYVERKVKELEARNWDIMPPPDQKKTFITALTPHGVAIVPQAVNQQIV